MPIRTNFPLVTPPNLVVPASMIPTVNLGLFASIVQPTAGIGQGSWSGPELSATKPAINHRLGWCRQLRCAWNVRLDGRSALQCNRARALDGLGTAELPLPNGLAYRQAKDAVHLDR